MIIIPTPEQNILMTKSLTDANISELKRFITSELLTFEYFSLFPILSESWIDDSLKTDATEPLNYEAYNLSVLFKIYS